MVTIFDVLGAQKITIVKVRVVVGCGFNYDQYKMSSRMLSLKEHWGNNNDDFGPTLSRSVRQGLVDKAPQMNYDDGTLQSSSSTTTPLFRNSRFEVNKSV